MILFIINQYSFASIPSLWHPPLPMITPLPPSPIPQWPSVHIIYTESHLPAGADPNPENPIPAPVLRYQDSTQTLSFSGEQITFQSTAVGRLLTVPLLHTIDQGDTLFSLVLPDMAEPTSGALTAISTFSITTRVTGPMTLPKPPQVMLYSTMNFSGTLSVSQMPQDPP
jgi:hypothetical protein